MPILLEFVFIFALGNSSITLIKPFMSTKRLDLIEMPINAYSVCSDGMQGENIVVSYPICFYRSEKRAQRHCELFKKKFPDYSFSVYPQRGYLGFCFDDVFSD